MDTEEFIRRNPIASVCEARGIKLHGTGTGKMALCPFHGDKNPSMSVDIENNIWFCHACDIGGGLIEFMAKLENLSDDEFKRRNGINTKEKTVKETVKRVLVKRYSYRDATGKEVYQSWRYDPKGFSQGHMGPDGKWIGSMDGVERVLYNLPEVLKAQTVWIAEGEKDADNLMALGYVATTNVGGAMKWLDAYSETLTNKDVIICGDNDDAGQKHVNVVFEALAGKVKTAKLVKIPGPHKDVSDFIKATKEKAKLELDRMVDEAVPFVNGIRLPIYSMAEIESRYRLYVRNLSKYSFNLSNWIPSLGSRIRGIVPGELVLILGDTGVGKTAILQSLAFHAHPLPTLLFEMELPEELLYERFLAMGSEMPCVKVEEAYQTTEDSLGTAGLEKKFSHIQICTESKLTLERLENLIVRSELKFGQKPVVVLIDYVQLLNGKGNRYEKTSNAAEGLKVLAKSTRTIFIIASQVHRNEYAETNEIGLFSGKDSGSLENSAGLVIGVWKEMKKEGVPQNANLMHMKILKNTKGKAGYEFLCNFNGENMRITESTERVQPTEAKHTFRPTSNDP